MSPPRCIAVIQGTTLSGFRAQTTVGPRREPNLLRGQSEMRRRSLETWRLMLSLFFLVSAAASFFKGGMGLFLLVFNIEEMSTPKTITSVSGCQDVGASFWNILHQVQSYKDKNPS